MKEDKKESSDQPSYEEKQNELTEKQSKRNRFKKKMTAKTKHGQPVMKHHISYLLHKIKSDS